ncbi:hypothetical protein VTN96DRAFT_9420 [Rasamsonia emersonii]
MTNAEVRTRLEVMIGHDDLLCQQSGMNIVRTRAVENDTHRNVGNSKVTVLDGSRLSSKAKCRSYAYPLENVFPNTISFGRGSPRAFNLIRWSRF